VLTSDKFKFIYYDIPKTASSSVIAFTRKADPNCVLNGRHNFAPNCKHYDEYFKWTIVRNPYDRIVSAWRSTQFPGLDKRKDKPPKPGAPPPVLDFNEWVKNHEHGTKRHQYNLIHDATGGNISEILALRFENLKDELLRLPFIGALGNPDEFPHRNRSTRAADWTEYLDEETERIIWDVYRNDFEAFGYGRHTL